MEATARRDSLCACSRAAGHLLAGAVAEPLVLRALDDTECGDRCCGLDGDSDDAVFHAPGPVRTASPAGSAARQTARRRLRLERLQLHGDTRSHEASILMTAVLGI